MSKTSPYRSDSNHHKAFDTPSVKDVVLLESEESELMEKDRLTIEVQFENTL
jgi:hypothetical protein